MNKKQIEMLKLLISVKGNCGDTKIRYMSCDLCPLTIICNDYNDNDELVKVAKNVLKKHTIKEIKKLLL